MSVAGHSCPEPASSEKIWVIEPGVMEMCNHRLQSGDFTATTISPRSSSIPVFQSH
jgi:hypothetical protein